MHLRMFTPDDWAKINQPSPTWGFRETAKEPVQVPCLVWNAAFREWQKANLRTDINPEKYPIWTPLPPAPVVKEASKFEVFKAAVEARFGPCSCPSLDKIWDEAVNAMGKEGA